ncbi:BTB domain-containing protein [Favolaschia claudopus]|uniref:BTB domain-containing protein n=1 Tax=Favolaschia claudopus TaxID=2862362 RepID=A0AAW0EBD9_9AGAR
MSSSAYQSELIRVEGLWFPHADLILRAENSLFRVYSGILEARSSVFRDMVAFPQPSQPESGENVLDGHPVVRLHDLANEVEVFLRAIFDSNFFERSPTPVDFHAVIGVLRLAHKYDVPYLRRRALSHLDSMYPTNLNDFRDINAGFAQHHIECQDHGDPIVSLAAIRAASEVGALWLIPAAGYRLAYDWDAMNEAIPHLQPHELKIYPRAQAEFVRATAVTHQFLRSLPSASCGSDACQQLVSRAYTGLANWHGNRFDCDPLAGWVFDFMERDGSANLCDSCHDTAQKQFQDAQQQFWDALPAVFGLPEWDHLLESKREALDGTT